MDAFINQQLETLKKKHLWRQVYGLESPQGPEIRINQRTYLSFCSNDYLGLANENEVQQAFKTGMQRFGLGSGASHLITGHSVAHDELEAKLAEYTNRPRALVFNNGYMANLAVLTTLCQRHDTVFMDRLNHASLVDGARLSGATIKRYPHRDSKRLRAQLETTEKVKLLISDGVFSMDGDLAPLKELAALAQEKNAFFMVDDAHGIGTVGATGKGCLEYFALDTQSVPILVGTFGKSLGTFGAFVAGSEALIELLMQKARPYIYTTALPPALAYATSKSLDILQQQAWRRHQLNHLIKYFKQRAKQAELPLQKSHTPIQPLIIGKAQKALEIAEKLKEKGLIISAIRPPTVPENSARLRITFSALHTEAHIDRLIEALIPLGLQRRF